MKIVVYCLLSIVYCTSCFAQKPDTSQPKQPSIILEGNYQGKNLYIQNPFAGNGVGFCVTKVFVNGIELDTIKYPKFEMYSSAFEIDLKSMGFKVGDKINIRILHKEDCKPKVLNPGGPKPKSTFELVKIEALKDGTIKWTAKGEIGKLPYVIEQFRWNKWIKVGEVDGKGGEQVNSYEKVINTHFGDNQVRIKQIDYTSQPRYSKPIYFMSDAKEVTFKFTQEDSKINFTSYTMYELYDKDGNIVKKGFAREVDCSKLSKGGYWLSYDNKIGEFVKN